MPEPSSALGHDSSVSGLCDSLIKAGGLSPWHPDCPKASRSVMPTLGECLHGRLARRLIAVRRRAVFVLAVG
jgi:hypothetical protein